MVAARQAGGPGGRGSFRMSWYGSRVAAQIDAGVQRAMDETAVILKARARSLAVVRTGAFREGIDSSVSATGGGRRKIVLSASAAHSIFVILGTSRMPARDPIRPAIDEEVPRLAARIRAAIGSG